MQGLYLFMRCIILFFGLVEVFTSTTDERTKRRKLWIHFCLFKSIIMLIPMFYLCNVSSLYQLGSGCGSPAHLITCAFHRFGAERSEEEEEHRLADSFFFDIWCQPELRCCREHRSMCAAETPRTQSLSMSFLLGDNTMADLHQHSHDAFH